MRFVSVSVHQRRQFVITNARQHRWAGNFVSVQMQNGQHHSITQNVHEFVRMPTRGQRTGFGFTIANHATHQQVGIIKRCAKRMQQRVAEFTAFVNGTGGFWCNVAGNSTRIRKLREQFCEPGGVARDVRIRLRVRAFEIRIGHHAWPAVPGASNENCIQIARADDAIQVRVHEVQTRRGAPVTKEAGFDLINCEWLAEQRIGPQINLTN